MNTLPVVITAAALHLIQSPSPHDEGILWQAPLPGRSSGSWFTLLPVPSHPRTWIVKRYPLVVKNSSPRLTR